MHTSSAIHHICLGLLSLLNKFVLIEQPITTFAVQSCASCFTYKCDNKTGGHCSELAIGAYPTFLYNSSGGGGLGRATIVGSRVNIEVRRLGVNVWCCFLHLHGALTRICSCRRGQREEL